MLQLRLINRVAGWDQRTGSCKAHSSRGPAANSAVALPRPARDLPALGFPLKPPDAGLSRGRVAREPAGTARQSWWLSDLEFSWSGETTLVA